MLSGLDFTQRERLYVALGRAQDVDRRTLRPERQRDEPARPSRPTHFLWAFDAGVATITLNRPERKNPLTFETYAELRDTFRASGLRHARSRRW